MTTTAEARLRDPGGPVPEPDRHTGPIADPIVPEEPPTELVPDPGRPVEPAEERLG